MSKASVYAETNLATVPFANAEDAWFWFVRCQVIRRQGAWIKSTTPRSQRPCDPDDIYRALIALTKAGKLHNAHLRILGQFGLVGRPPDPRNESEAIASRYWQESLDKLTTVLSDKGIIG